MHFLGAVSVQDQSLTAGTVQSHPSSCESGLLVTGKGKRKRQTGQVNAAHACCTWAGGLHMQLLAKTGRNNLHCDGTTTAQVRKKGSSTASVSLLWTPFLSWSEINGVEQ